MQTLELEDYNKIKPYLDDANYEGYNSNFITMMMWNHEYHVQYEIHDHFMVMLQNYNGLHYFAMPFCKPEYYQEAFEYMMEYAKKHQFSFLMDGVIQSVRDVLKDIYGDAILAIRTPFNDDYVYEKKALETLSGKKMQKRRNHFNAFLKENSEYIYKEIEDEDIDNVLACLRRWDNRHDNEESVQSEFVGIMYLLMNRHRLDIRTGCIYIKGRLEAFTIASPLKHQTIQIHIEKANKDIRGLYVAISKFFLENNYPDYVYVNREEDMGIEYLRQAKRSLHPCKMVEKYFIKCNHITLHPASQEDTKEIKALWQENFEEETETTTAFYFSTLYKPECTYVAKDQDTVVSAMQIVPFTIDNYGQVETVYFILGVCTKKEYQHNTIMKRLLQHVLASSPYKEHRIFLQAYNPDIYRSLGFHEQYFHQRILLDSGAYDKEDDVICRSILPNEALTLYIHFCKRFTGYRIRDLLYYQEYITKRCLAYEDHFVGFYQGEQLLGYCIYHSNETTIEIQELIYTTFEDLTKIVSYFACKQQDVIMECDMSVKLSGKCEVVCTMMSNDVKSNENIETLYINEIL